jgi:hypothetical protein
MGSGKMNSTLKKYVKKNYPNSKADLFSVFMEKVSDLTINDGYFAMITQHSWMFLSSFETLRKKLQTKTIVNMAHLGPRAFEEIGGEVVQSTAFVMFNQSIENYIGTYERLIGYNSQKAKEIAYLSAVNVNKNKILFCSKQANFSKIPGSPIAYWVSKNLIASFKNNSLNNYLITREGMATGDNKKFLRFWFEILFNQITFNTENYDKTLWVPYNKGGKYKKWNVYENYVVNWGNNGSKIKNNINLKTGNIRSHNYNGMFGLKRGITWSSLSSGKISFRYTPKGYLFDSKGAMGFLRDTLDINDLYQVLGFLNSNVASKYLEIFSPTLDYKVGDIVLLPIIENNNKNFTIDVITKKNIKIVMDYDSQFEYFWDFKHHPLLNHIAEHNHSPPLLQTFLKAFLI